MSLIFAFIFAIIVFTLMCLLSTYLEYLFYKKDDEKFKEYTFKMYVEERGIF